ncbi:iron-siderophore ABC transporter substrate-binding protein [Micrococcales bacterium 31B]|nr:iron-siderophore ABC transporter substrate-binding protein [Micrococcales bacterium 31B]
MPLSRRLVLQTFVASSATAALGAVLAACSNSAAPTTGGGAASAAAGASEGFPVTLQSALGSVTLDSPPQRVVTLSWMNQDAAIALGAVPVGMPKFAWGANSDGVLAWDKTALDGKTLPTLLDDSQSIPFEAIAALKPDVVLAGYSGLTAEDYATLSKFTKVVAYPDAPYATDWREVITLAGQALGKSAEATALIDKTVAYMTTEAAKHPEIAGRTFAYCATFTDGQLSVYKDTDARVRFVTDLGLTLAPSVGELAPQDDAFYFDLSYEQVSSLASDILIAFFDTEDALAAFTANPLIAAMPQVKSGAFAAMVGADLAMAASAPSSLSIPYMLPTYLEKISAAVSAAG